MSPIIGKVIKRHRLWKDLKTKQVAELADISLNYYREIERGNYDPSIKTLGKIAYALGKPLWEIIKEAEEEMQKEAEATDEQGE